MSGELADSTIARVEQDGRVLSGGSDATKLAETMERHAPEPVEGAKGTSAGPAADGKPQEAAPAPDVDKPTRGRQRFADLTRERDEAKGETAKERTARETLEREVADLRARVASPARAAGSAKPAAPADEKPAERFKFPAYDDAYIAAHAGASYDDWEIDRLDAYAEWRDQRVNIDQRIAQTVAARDAQRDFDATMDRARAKGREAYSDFDAVFAAYGKDPVNLHKDDDKADARVRFIVAHPQSEHIQYAIMKDPAFARKLAGLDDIAFGIEIAALAKPAAGVPAKPAWTPPPAPHTPVNGSTATVSAPSGELAKKGNFDAYRVKRAQERGVKPRY